MLSLSFIFYNLYIIIDFGDDSPAIGRFPGDQYQMSQFHHHSPTNRYGATNREYEPPSGAVFYNSDYNRPHYGKFIIVTDNFKLCGRKFLPFFPLSAVQKREETFDPSAFLVKINFFVKFLIYHSIFM